MSDTLAALYLRVSTLDQHPETQLHDLRQMAAQRGLEIAGVYEDRITGARASRPGLDRLMSDARQGKFQVLVVWSCDRLARSVRHFLETLDELNRLGVEFLSFREQLDTGGPLGRAVVIIVGAIAELERSLIVERVRAGLRRAKLEGRRLGRPPVQVNREALWQDRQGGRPITELAQAYHISRSSVCKLLKEISGDGHLKGVQKTPAQPSPQAADSTRAENPI